eukprot:TRINITY_DN17139_c0_g1_i1.p1 TRINITY_DN17139_c0_g1~~TRINITY_DN17139_c0_g1_i1.p1  ORF type:complete len:491 (+),score=98.32 TRINITY_DN17139_c0_g1_i1:74-1474(+)
MPTASAALAHWLRLDSTSFYAVKCSPGFQCASKVSIFPMGHDGVYHHTRGVRALEPSDPDRFRDWMETYEVGCPSRGSMTDAGKCKDSGGSVEEQGLCYSSTGYEGGPQAPCQDPGDCICLKNATPNGSRTLGHRHLETVDGKDLIRGSYDVEQVSKCENCEQLTHAKECKECSDCVYRERSMGGVMKLGCWAADPAAARISRLKGKEAAEYLGGRTTVQKEMNLIPHYKLFDPGEGHDPVSEPGSKEEEEELEIARKSGPQLPYQSVREVLSAQQWIQTYKQAAPAVQKLLDSQVRSVDEWAKTASTLRCVKKSRKRLGNDILGKVEKVLSIRNMCQSMQETAAKIAPDHTGFNGGDLLHCVRADNGSCKNLNCYANDQHLKDGLRQLLVRNDECFHFWEKSATKATLKCSDDIKQAAAPTASATDATVAKQSASMLAVLGAAMLESTSQATRQTMFQEFLSTRD